MELDIHCLSGVSLNILKKNNSMNNKIKDSDLEINIINNLQQSVFRDITIPNFDTTWSLDLGLIDSLKIVEIEKNTYSKIPIEVVLDKYKSDNSVIYRYNSNNFRSDEFIAEHDGMHILFAGCSETEGVGGNIEDAWSNILYKKISKDIKCSGFFNLGRSGFGWQKIINNCLIYFKKYGIPDFLFILLPNSGRGYYFSEEENKLVYWQKYPPLGYTPHKAEGEANSFLDIPQTIEEYKESFMNFVAGWNAFIFLCEQLGIKMLFSSWAFEDGNNIIKNKLFKDKYVSIINVTDYDKVNFEYKNTFIKNFIKNNAEKNFLLEKRDGHKGLAIHNFWADSFYNEYIKII